MKTRFFPLFLLFFLFWAISPSLCHAAPQMFAVGASILENDEAQHYRRGRLGLSARGA